MNQNTTCCKWRLALIATGVSLWAFSLLADVAFWAGWATLSAKPLAFYSIIAGIAVMSVAAFVCGFDLGYRTEDAPAKAELLDGGVILAAILLFVLNGVLRKQLGDSMLPVLLSVLGLAGVLAELWLDLTDSGYRFQRRRPL